MSSGMPCGIWSRTIRSSCSTAVALIDLLLAASVYFVMRGGGASRPFAYFVATYWSALICMLDPPRVGFFALLLALLAVLAEYRGKHLGRPSCCWQPRHFLDQNTYWQGFSGCSSEAGRGLPAARDLRLRWLRPSPWHSRLRVLFRGCVASAYGPPLASTIPCAGAAEHPPLLDDPWVAWGRAVAIGFPGAHSIGGALLTNPREFLHHVVGNLYEYPGLLVSLAASPALPGRVVGPAILSGLLLAVAVRRRWPQPVAWRTSTLLLAACASVLPSLLVKPKAVYALPLVLLILIGMARVARSLPARRALNAAGWAWPRA